jgi:sec-independent protein translocase protein TatA
LILKTTAARMGRPRIDIFFWRGVAMFGVLGMGPMELVIVGVIAVLLFGKRLPEVSRSLGKSIVEFKKGMADVQSEVISASSAQPSSRVQHHSAIDDRDEPTAPKFEPPAHEPTVASDQNLSGPAQPA